MNGIEIENLFGENTDKVLTFATPEAQENALSQIIFNSSKLFVIYFCG